MQDHEFEKQVHQKMEEISMLPSDAVWKGVEKRLHAGGKSTPWLVWLPFLLIALSICGYMIFNPSSNSSDTKLVSGSANQSMNNSITKEESGSSQREKGIQFREADRAGDKINNKQATQAGTGAIASEIQRRSPGQNEPLVTARNTGSTTGINQHASRPAKNKKTAANANGTTGAISPASTNTTAGYTLNGIDAQPLSIIQDSATSKDPKPVLPPAIQRAKFDSLINTSEVLDSPRLFASNFLKNNSRRRNLQWGIAVQGSRTGISNGHLNGLFSNAVVADVNNSFSSPATGAGQGPSMIYIPPSALRPGAGFSAGAYLKKQLSRRTSVSAGLQYSRATTSHKVGVRIDSSLVLRQSNTLDQKDIEEYYKTGNASVYNNKYHFLVVPVTLQTRLTGARSIPVHWDLGFSLSRLMATNALHFDGNARVYYTDISLFNRTHLNLTTGFPIGLVSRERFSVKAGPFVEYGVSNLIKKERSAGKHFSYIGLKAYMDLFTN